MAGTEWSHASSCLVTVQLVALGLLHGALCTFSWPRSTYGRCGGPSLFSSSAGSLRVWPGWLTWLAANPVHCVKYCTDVLCCGTLHGLCLFDLLCWVLFVHLILSPLTSCGCTCGQFWGGGGGELGRWLFCGSAPLLPLIPCQQS